MNRFGKAIVALLVLAVVGIVSMVRFTDGDGPQPAPKPVAAPDGIAIGPSGIGVPVAGVKPAALVDSFRDPRTGHVHGALDIPALRGTAVMAASPGIVEKIFESQAGGHTVYVRSPNGRWVYYYAHLDSYADGLAEGQRVARGQPIGTVGYSGNADPAGPHLHFEIKAMAPGETWYQGRAINPYPLLAGEDGHAA